MQVCANCLVPIRGRAGGPDRGPDIAWCSQCPACAQVVADQLEVVVDRPGGESIQIRRCRACGVDRVCRSSWATRCHVCLDDRSSSDLNVMRRGRSLMGTFGANPGMADLVRSFLGLADQDRMPVRGVAEFVSAMALAAELAEYDQPGWTVLATDVHGLPWTGTRWQSNSHGTWGRHDQCGGLQKIERARTECATCEPEPGARTHRARADDPYLLYLVRNGNVVKFGRGYPHRVRAHVRSGAVPIQVVTARHVEVVAAELVLKRRFRGHAESAAAALPATFGAGTEILPVGVQVDLQALLPHGDDVTHRYR